MTTTDPASPFVADDLVRAMDELGADHLQVMRRTSSDTWITVTVREQGIMDIETPGFPGIVIERKEGGL